MFQEFVDNHPIELLLGLAELDLNRSFTDFGKRDDWQRKQPRGVCSAKENRTDNINQPLLAGSRALLQHELDCSMDSFGKYENTYAAEVVYKCFVSPYVRDVQEVEVRPEFRSMAFSRQARSAIKIAPKWGTSAVLEISYFRSGVPLKIHLKCP